MSTPQETLSAAFVLTLEQRAALDVICGQEVRLRQPLEHFLRAHYESVANDSQPSHGERDAAQAGPTDATPGMVIAGRYRLLEIIGEGGMGSVWLAEQSQPVKREVAIKLVKPGMDSRKVMTRFEAERQALAMMDHPNIAKVLDGGLTDQGRPYFAMEYVKGVPLNEYCDEARLSLAQRLTLFVAVCQAIQHSHQKGIIHRDLKPTNILVCDYDGRPVPKVIDFGLAKAMFAALTDQSQQSFHGLMVGTPLYMSPEQADISNVDVDTRTDIYSLGVILYELLAGSAPLECQELNNVSLSEILRFIKEVEPPKPSTRVSGTSRAHLSLIADKRKVVPNQLRKSIAGDLDWIVMKALDKERSRRYETANGLARDVERYLNGEPVEACPPSASYRMKKFVRRHKGPVAAWVGLTVALAAGVIGTTFGLVRAMSERAHALAAELQAVRDRDFAQQAARAERIAKESEAEQLQIANQEKRRAEEQRQIAEDQRQIAEEQQRIADEQRLVAEASEQRANKERERAEKETRVAQAVRDFLKNDLLLQADVRFQADSLRVTNGGFEIRENPTIKELLLRAASELTPEKIDMKFPDLTYVQIELLLTVGNSFLGTGSYELALSHLQRASQLSQDVLGPDYSSTLIARDSLGRAYLAAGRTAEAISEFEQARATSEKKRGADDPDTLSIASHLALAYLTAAKTDDAITLFERVSSAQTRVLAQDHPATLVTLQNLARAYLASGRSSEAIDLLDVVLSARSRRFGPDDPRTLGTMASLAGAYQATGEIIKAIKELESVRTAYERIFGPEHPSTLIALNNLATAYQSAGRIEDSIGILEQVAKGSATRLGQDHPITLTALTNLANAYQLVKRTAEAITVLERVYEARKIVPGPKHPLALSTLDSLARAYLELGKTEESITLFEQVRDGLETNFGPDHPDSLVVCSNLGSAYRVHGRTVEAIAVLEKVLKTQTSRLASDHPSTLATVNNLASAYQTAGRHGEAIHLFEQLQDRIVNKLGADHRDTLAAIFNLASAYQAAGRTSESIPLLEKVHVAQFRVLERDDASLLATLESLGTAYESTGRLIDAIKVFEEVREALLRQLGGDHLKTLEMSQKLAKAYTSTKQFEKSAALLKDLLDRRTKQLGREHSEAKIAVAMLGLNYLSDGRAQDALPHLEEAWQASHQDPRLREFGTPLLDAFVRMGKSTEAIGLVQELVSDARKMLPDNDTQLADKLAQFSIALLQVKAYLDAERLLRECVTIGEKAHLNDRTTVNTKWMLGMSLLGQRQFANAEPLLIAGYKGIKQLEEQTPQVKTNSIEAMRLLVELYKAWGKQKNAADWQKQLDALKAELSKSETGK